MWVSVKAVLPQIDPETRRKQALVEFKGKHITLGAYASLILPGPLYRNVAVLPRDALRPGNTVWILSDNGTLQMRTVTVSARDLMNIVIVDGLGRGRTRYPIPYRQPLAAACRCA